MAKSAPKSGIVETTETTGTGPLTLAGAVAGFLGLGSADNGKTYDFALRVEGSLFEVFAGTYTHATRVLTRDTIFRNINNNTDPVNLGAGAKTVSLIISGEKVMMRDVENVMQAHTKYAGYRRYTDPDGTSWWDGSIDNVDRFMAEGLEVFRVDGPAKQVIITATDDSAAEGPELQLDRNSATPAADDSAGVLRFTGRDVAGAKVTLVKARAVIKSPSTGAVTSAWNVDVMNAGTLTPVLSIESSKAILRTGCAFFTGGKTVSNAGVVGGELAADGYVVGVANDQVGAFFGRNGSDGLVISILRDGTSMGGIKCTAGVVAIEGAVMSHPSAWAPGVDGSAFEGIGWVVCAAPGLLEDAAQRHPLVRPSDRPADPAVYGVTSGPHKREDGAAALSVDASGSGLIRVTGPACIGQLLQSSAIPGVACAQADDIRRASTVAKATQDSLDDGTVRLVPCTLMVG